MINVSLGLSTCTLSLTFSFLFTLGEEAMAGTAIEPVTNEQIDLASAGRTDSFSLIDDEQFKALKRTFLASGKDRRASLPTVTIDNKFQVQLFTLKEESGCPWVKVKSWFVEACPDAIQSRIRNLIERYMKSYKSLSLEEQASFLSVPIGINFISESLSSVGISRLNATSPPSQEIFESSKSDFTHQEDMDTTDRLSAPNILQKTSDCLRSSRGLSKSVSE